MGLRRALKTLLNYKEPEPFLNDSYSQEGEDMILHRMFETKFDGFFVDVGALHPIRFSNTYKFYKKGWRGINIDALPGSMGLFNQVRPLDINLEIPVSDQVEVLPFYVFNEPALNTFSKELADERASKPEYNIDKVINIETHSLAEILEKYLPAGQTIDFLTIDAEGFDYQILKSNNWEEFIPKIVLIESELDYDEMLLSELNQFMNAKGYSFFAKTVRTFFFKHNSL